MKRLAVLGIAALFLTSVNAQQNNSGSASQQNSSGSGTQQNNAGSGTQNGKIGNISIQQFQQTNAKGNQAVAAVKATSTPLSSADQQLMMQVASGGKMQLALSQAAIDKVQSPEAKLLAQSEVEEQTGVAAKLKEIASAKGITLPEGPDAAATAAVSKMNGSTGNALDAYYVKESGVNGHVLLEQTMTKVAGSAKDPALKELANATLPVIKLHLQVSREVSRTMNNTAQTSSRK